MKYLPTTLKEGQATVIHGPVAVSLARNGSVELISQGCPDELFSIEDAKGIAEKIIKKRKATRNRKRKLA